MNLTDLWNSFTTMLSSPQSGFLEALQRFQPTQAPAPGAVGPIFDPSKQLSDGQELVRGVRAGQIERAVNGAAPAAPAGFQGFPEAGGQGFFTGPSGRRQISPAEAEQIRRGMRR